MEKEIIQYLNEKYEEALDAYLLNKDIPENEEYYLGYLDMIAEIRAYVKKLEGEKQLFVDFL